jgi:hypothetical protein
LPLSADSDRAELLSRLIETQASYRRLAGAPAIVRSEMLESAFEAVLLVGRFNRAHPELRITPLPCC